MFFAALPGKGGLEKRAVPQRPTSPLRGHPSACRRPWAGPGRQRSLPFTAPTSETSHPGASAHPTGAPRAVGSSCTTLDALHGGIVTRLGRTALGESSECTQHARALPARGVPKAQPKPPLRLTARPHPSLAQAMSTFGSQVPGAPRLPLPAGTPFVMPRLVRLIAPSSCPPPSTCRPLLRDPSSRSIDALRSMRRVRCRYRRRDWKGHFPLPSRHLLRLLHRYRCASCPPSPPLGSLSPSASPTFLRNPSLAALVARTEMAGVG